MPSCLCGENAIHCVSPVNQLTLVLADEPTASLDSERAFQVVQTLASLVHEQNRVGIMVTHDLRLVEYTDKVIQYDN